VLFSIVGLTFRMVSWSTERVLETIGKLVGFVIDYALFRLLLWLCTKLGFVGSLLLGLHVLVFWFFCVRTGAGA